MRSGKSAVTLGSTRHVVFPNEVDSMRIAYRHSVLFLSTAAGFICSLHRKVPWLARLITQPVLDGEQAAVSLQCSRLTFAMRSEGHSESSSIWTTADKAVNSSQSARCNGSARRCGPRNFRARLSEPQRPRSEKTPGTFPLCLSAPPCCDSQSRAPFGNPNGILSQSPGLRGTSYPGSPSTKHPQPQRGCGQSGGRSIIAG
jgi:hypothetical protein